jgi:glycosyltransferase involved in cell wall biosynthesis
LFRNLHFILSKKSPGLMKEVNYLNRIFSPVEDTVSTVKLSTLLQIGKNDDIRYVSFYNTSILTCLYILFFKLIYPKKYILMFVHEPYKLHMSKYYKQRIVIKNYLIFTINGICGRLSDRVVYLSEYGYKMGQFNVFLRNKTSSIVTLKLKTLQIPKVPKKSQFLVYGQINQTKTLDWLEELVKTIPEDVEFKVKILTANALPFDQEEIFKSNGHFIELDVRSELSDACIAQNIRESVGTIHFHNGVTQSGAVVESFRNNVPVVCRNTPGFQQHVDLEYGELVDQLSYQILKDIAEKFQMNCSQYEKQLGSYFKENFTLEMNTAQRAKYYSALIK